MQVRVTVRTAEGIDADLQIDAPVAGSTAELATLLTEFTGHPRAAPVSGPNGPLPSGARLGDPGLRHGSIITIGTPGRRAMTVTSVLQLRVIAGPSAGQVRALTRAGTTIGRGSDNDLTIEDADISRQHAELRVSEAGVDIRDCGSTNGTWLIGPGAPVERSVTSQWQRLGADALIRLGNTLVSAATVADPPAAQRRASDGTVHISPPSPSAPLPADNPITFPAAVERGHRPAAQWLSVLLPGLLAVGLAVLMHNPQFLAFSLLTPLGMIAATIADRRSKRRLGRRERASRALAEQVAIDQLRGQLIQEAIRRRTRFPDPAAIAQSVALPDCRLWERSRQSQDFLVLRLGTADQQSNCVVTRGETVREDIVVGSVPVTIDLKLGPLAIVGPKPVATRIAYALCCQLFALHPPGELSVFAMLGDTPSRWRWLRWLPHTVAGIGLREQDNNEIVAGLQLTLRDRQRDGTHRSGEGVSWDGPWTVLLLDPAEVASRDLRDLVTGGTRFGITAICLADAESKLVLPFSALAIVLSETGATIGLQRPGQPYETVCADQVSAAFADRIGRALAPIRDGRASSVAALPDRVRLIELLPHPSTDPERLLESWGQAGPGTAVTPIGLDVSGTLRLDLLRDGPHVLIAGSTGSGKSELLLCLVAGLAAGYSPTDIGFVLIDYKGGAAFAECAELPHTLGMVTDLDSHLTRRALISLEAELRRRERAFAATAATDLDSYRASTRSRSEPIPRLVLVVDEFASLADELPDFVSGLVGIAQRGRSLGIHLVLATQRPAGIVSAEIRANMATRIALRVVDPGDSTDVIGTAAAARIDKALPGRAIGVFGSAATEFQAAQVGLEAGVEQRTRLVLLDEWNRPIEACTVRDTTKTDLQLLCDATREAAKRLDRTLPSRPWLPELPGLITTADVPSGRDSPWRVHLGLIDDPEHQRQYPFAHDLISGGSIGVIGGPRSGRSTLVRTALATAAGQLSSNELHCYVLDCAGGSLRPLTQLPHCGAVVTRDDPAAIRTLIGRLTSTADARRHRLAELGVSSVAEARALGERFPAIVLAIDGWESLVQASETADSGRTVEAIITLLRECAAVGFSIIVAGDRALLSTRLTSVLSRRFLLELLDRNDYGLVGLRPAAVPKRFVAGRAISAEHGLEVQFAMLAADPGPAAQWAAVREIAALQPAACAGSAPIVIRSLPASISAAELSVLTDSMPQTVMSTTTTTTATATAQLQSLALGVGGDDASPVQLDIFAGDARFLICGPPRSGRSTAALTIGAWALQAGHELLVIATSRSPLSSWARQRDVLMLSPLADETDRLVAFAGDLIVIDDCELLADTPAGDAVLRLIIGRGSAVLATARTEDLLVSFRGIGHELRRSRTGLLLQPNAGDGDPFGISISTRAGHQPAGRGLLVTDELRRTHPDGLAIQVVSDAVGPI